MDIHLKSHAETRKLGSTIASSITNSVLIGLIGKLGAGKTTLSQGLADELEVEEEVSSPTFLMLNEYHSGRIPVYHFDLYRLQEDLDADSAATSALRAELEEIMHSQDIVVAIVEWLDLYEGFCAGIDTLFVRIEYKDEEREANLSARGAAAEKLLSALRRQYGNYDLPS